jgi:opacity protein-like surface antigen
MASYQMAPGTGTATPNHSRWNLTCSVMAGVSFSLGYNRIIDIGYRHIDMGYVLGGPPGNQLTLNSLTGDEVRIGIRYLLS